MSLCRYEDVARQGSWVDAVTRASAELLVNDDDGDDVSDYNSSDDEPSYSMTEGGDGRTGSHDTKGEITRRGGRTVKGGTPKAAKDRIHGNDCSVNKGIKRGGGGRGGECHLF